MANIIETTDAPGDLTTTYRMNVGDTFSGSIDLPGVGSDWIAVDLSAGVTYAMHLFGAPTGAGTLHDPYLYLHGATGDRLQSNDDGGIGFESYLQYTPTEDATFYISASAYGNETGTYELWIHDRVFGQPGENLLGTDMGQETFMTGDDDRFAALTGNDTVHGGNGSDTLFGGAGNDMVFGGAGWDSLYGGDGNDTVQGGLGADWAALDGGDDLFNDTDQRGLRGSDTVYGGDGNDTVQGGGGNDWFYGQAGNDLIFGRLDNDSLWGGLGMDTLDGGDGHDQAFGGEGADLLRGGAGNDTLHGRDGDDILDAGDGDDTLYGGDGADSLNGGDGDDTLFGGTGDDTIDAGDGDDDVYGGDGANLIFLGAGDDAYKSAYSVTNTDQRDTVYGGTGNDDIRGSATANHFLGEDGRDTLYGYAGDDTLDGGAGDDALYGGAGTNALTGGSGADVFVVTNEMFVNTVADFELGIDRLHLSEGIWGGGLSASTVVARFGSVGADGVTLDFGTGQSILLEGLNSLIGLENDLRTDTGGVLGSTVELSDREAGTGGFVINGVSAFDNSGYSVSGAGDVNGDGFDDLIVGALYDDPNGTGSGASFVVFGGDFTGAATQVGTVNADLLTGSGANDVIFAGIGDDTIDGGGGTDRLSGGQGADVLIFRDLEGRTSVLDFDGTQGDALDVSAFNFADFAALQDVFSAFGPGGHDTQIDLDADTVVILEDVSFDMLTADYFVLA